MKTLVLSGRQGLLARLVPGVAAASGFLGSCLTHLRDRAESLARILETVVSQTNDDVVVVDHELKVTRFSKARNLGPEGTSLKEIERRYPLYGGDGSRLSLDQWPVVRALDGESVGGESYWMWDRGQNREFMFSAAPVFNGRGRITTAVGIRRDLSEARRLDRLKDDFIGLVSHELRDPLAVVRALAQLGVLETADSHRTELFRRIIDKVDTITGLVEMMIEAGRLDSGEIALVPERIELEVLLSREVELLRAEFPDHNLVLDTASAKPIIADRAKLLQALSHIVSNACKYSPYGSTVTVELEEVESGVEIRVADEGIGVPDAERDLVFSKFFRGANDINRNSSGLGLGLYIAKRLVELHGGHIWMEAGTVGGSKVRLSLPRVCLGHSEVLEQGAIKSERRVLAREVRRQPGVVW